MVAPTSGFAPAAPACRGITWRRRSKSPTYKRRRSDTPTLPLPDEPTKNSWRSREKVVVLEARQAPLASRLLRRRQLSPNPRRPPPLKPRLKVRADAGRVPGEPARTVAEPRPRAV